MIGNFEERYINGVKSTTYTLGRSVAQWMGPWYKDHALAAGLGQQRVGISDQAAVGVLRDVDDDAQAFTGSIFQWLAAAGVNVGILGKDQNGRVATDPIPAGVTFAKIQLVGAAYDPTLWSATYVEYSGANPAYGVGVSPPATTQYFYQLTATATWASGEARVTTSIQHRLRVGDTVAINMNVAGYNGNQFLVSAVESSTVFRYAVPGPLGAASGNAYNRQTYGAIQLGGELDISKLENLEVTFEFRVRRDDEPVAITVTLELETSVLPKVGANAQHLGRWRALV